MSNSDEIWDGIFSKAQSADIFDRLAALTRSVFLLELALIAIGTKHRKYEGVTRLVNISKLVVEYPPKVIADILDVIKARNKAVHGGIVPTSDDCLEGVEKLFDVWSWMRSQFVTSQTAANLVEMILKSDFFYDAFLFGSLARNKRNPGDIDLLILDSGEISFLGENYGNQRSVIQRRILEKAKIEDTAYLAALDLDWVDLVVVHHKEFIDNPNYIRYIASTERPYFLLNITDGIKKYDKNTREWLDCDELPFERWNKIRKELEREGIVSEQ